MFFFYFFKHEREVAQAFPNHAELAGIAETEVVRYHKSPRGQRLKNSPSEAQGVINVMEDFYVE